MYTSYFCYYLLQHAPERSVAVIDFSGTIARSWRSTFGLVEHRIYGSLLQIEFGSCPPTTSFTSASAVTSVIIPTLICCTGLNNEVQHISQQRKIYCDFFAFLVHAQAPRECPACGSMAPPPPPPPGSAEEDPTMRSLEDMTRALMTSIANNDDMQWMGLDIQMNIETVQKTVMEIMGKVQHTWTKVDNIEECH